ncbi:MAG: hypothetical protein AB1806_15290 [Acidobacteriota bacterium]
MSERDERLRKLEPKLGDATTRALWLAAQDSKLRKHVDPFISALGDSLLSESYKHQHILLPPPPDVSGPIRCGTVHYDRPCGVFGLTKAEIVKKIAIVGASGTVKTTLAFQIAKSLLEADVPVCVWDPKRSWRSLIEYVPERDVRIFTVGRDISPWYQNFLIPLPGVDVQRFDAWVGRVESDAMYGGLGSRATRDDVGRKLRALYPMPEAAEQHFTYADIHAELKRAALQASRGGKRGGDWMATALRISSEIVSSLGNVINVRRNVMEQDVDRAKLVVFECDYVPTEAYVYLVTQFILRDFLKHMDTEQPDELRKVIIFEEAARIFKMGYEQPTLQQLYREVREKGLGLVSLLQSAGDCDVTMWSNTQTLMVMRQITTADIHAVGKAIAFERPRDRDYVARLGTGEAIVRLPDRYRFPFLIKTDDIKKVVVPDVRIRELAIARLKALGAPVFDTESEAGPPFPVEKRASEPVLQKAEAPCVLGAPVIMNVPRATGPLGELRTPEEPSEPVSRLVGAPGAPVSEPAKPTSRLERNESAMAHLLHQIASRPGRPITYLYSDLQLAKSVGDRTKKMLLARGLAQETRVPGLGGIQKHLHVTDAGARWLSEHSELLARPLVRWQTKRFGGPKSRELEQRAIEWAQRVKGATHWQTEARDGFGGRFDLKFESAEGSFVVELISGESKGLETRHLTRAADNGLPYYGICWNDTVRERIRRYLRAQDIEENQRVVLLTQDETTLTDKSMQEWGVTSVRQNLASL